MFVTGQKLTSFLRNSRVISWNLPLREFTFTNECHEGNAI